MSKDQENNNFNTGPNNFGLPGDYFQKSANSIFNKIEWIEEHKEFAALTELKNSEKNKTAFIVPENYFDKAESKLELVSYEHLWKQNKDAGFNVPQNYFDELEIRELSKVLLNDENELAQFVNLNSIKKQNGFSVPENYFTDSEDQIISALNKGARVINLFKPKIFFSAVAAVLTIVLGLWVYHQYFKPVTGKDCGSLACLDKNDIVKSKNLESLDNDELYELVNTKKLEKTLETKSDLSAGKAGKKTDKQNTDSSLKNVSADELLDEI